MELISTLNTTRSIGCEFEGYIILTGSGDGHSAQESLAHALTENGIRAIARGYSHDPLPPDVLVAVEYDSSIVPEQRYRGIRWAPIEVKTAKLSGIEEWERIVPPMLELLRYAGMRLNHTCSYHIHLSFEAIKQDVRKVRSLWNLYHRHQETIFGLVAPSRQANTYCRPLPNESKLLHGANSIRELRRRLGRYDRYTFLNTTHLFDENPRVEIRVHHGTTDPAKARAWLILHLAMLDHACRRACQAAPAPLPLSRKSFDALMTTIGMKPNTRVYAQVDPVLRDSAKALLKTFRKFNPQFFPRRQNKALANDLLAVGEEQ